VGGSQSSLERRRKEGKRPHITYQGKWVKKSTSQSEGGKPILEYRFEGREKGKSSANREKKKG